VPGIPPEDALAFFEQKAIEISGVLNEKIRADAKQVLMNALKTGQGTQETIQQLRAIFEPYLGDPLVIDPAKKAVTQPFRLETIIRTNTTEAVNKGFKDSVDREVASGHVIGWEYSAIIDTRQTEVCEHLDEEILMPDSDALERLTPPNHFNCRSVLIPVTKDEAPVEFITETDIGRGLQLKAKGFGESKTAMRNLLSSEEVAELVRQEMSAPEPTVVNVHPATPVVNVTNEPPVVNIAPVAPETHIHQEATVVNIEQKPPIVRVDAPVVNVTQDPPVTHIHQDAPVVNVEPPVVNVTQEPPVTHIHQEPPVVNIEQKPPIVRVDAPVIHVHVPEPKKRKIKKTVKRDDLGRIVNVTEEEEDVAGSD
jgi:SPP1 gp7 family putative phage head morphogenesis protein